jgi:hypothetical protein
MSKCRLDIEKDIRSSYKRVLEKEVSDFIIDNENSLYSIELNYKGNNNKETVRRKVYLANKKAGLNYGIYNNSDEIKIDVPQKDIDIAWEDYQKSNPIQTETETIINTEQINQKLINGFLKDFNIDTEDFENLKDAIGFDAYTASDLIAKAIVYEKGESITPEVAYFAYSMLGKQNNKLSSELKYLINKWDKYNERFEYHKNIQKEKIGFISDKKEWINKIRDLVILDFLKEKIEQHYINPQKFKKSLDTKWTSEDFSIWNKIISWLENLLSSYSSKYKSQKEKLSDIGLSIADEILNRNYEYFNYNLKEEQIQKYYKNTIESDAFAKELVEFCQQQLNLILTGSLALRKAGTVFRSLLETLHDIDFVVPYQLNMVNNKVIQPLINPLTGQLPKNLSVVDNYLNELPWYKEFKQKYPSYKIINAFYGKEHTAYESMTVQGVIDGKFYDKNGVHTEEKSYYKKDEITKKPIKVTETIKVSHKKGDLIPNTGYVIDFFIRFQPKQEEHENYFKLWKEIMIAKIKMGRDKDFIDWKAFVPYLKSKNSFNFNYEGFRHINYESSSKYLLDDSTEIVNTKPIIDEIKPGVEELFDSNPELANEVYEALGFKEYSQETKNKLALTERLKDIFKDKSTVLIKAGKNSDAFYIDLVKTSDDRYFYFSESQSPEEISKKRFAEEVEFIDGEVATTKEKDEFINNYLQIADLNQISENPLLSDEEKEEATKDILKKVTPQQKQQALQLYSQYLDNKGINIEKGNLRNQIQNIASNSQYEHNKRLAEYLLDFNFDKNDFFKFAEDFTENFEEFGLYYKDENGIKNISIKANKIAKEIPLSNRQYFEEQVLLHETIHLLTVDNLNKNKEIKKEISKLMQVAKSKLDTSKYTNAFSSEAEFIAHTFSDYNFQKELKSIPYEKSNVWNKFISLIQDMAKYLSINIENSLLEKIVEVSQPLFNNILGSKQDIEGFKQFAKDKPTQANNESGMSMTAQEYEIFNQDTEIQENKKCK